MKGDVSRRTFLAAKHYHCVLMQQGRVQLDADWNEQIDLSAHRIETETLDVIGAAGGPEDAAGFSIAPAGATDFTIGAGRYYVAGLLVVNEAAVAYTAQDDHPAPALLVAGHRYLVYLDVWQRHVTHLDDPYTREVALGGPDTATRVRTVWQVKVVDTADINCIDAWEVFFPPLAPSGRLRAGTATVTASDNPCLVRPTAGYRGLENQLYRVEIHKPGGGMDLAPGAGTITVAFDPNHPTQLAASAGPWAAGDAVQIVSTTRPDAGPVFLITGVVGTTLGLNAEVHGITFSANTRLRRITGAVFKWSRDNGAIVARIKSIDVPTHTVLELDSLGPDDVIGFQSGDFVELSDDRHELGGAGPGSALPGELLQVKRVLPGTTKLELVAPTTFVVDPNRHPKLRRWNGLGPVVYHALSLDALDDHNWIELELGLRVRLTQAGEYRTGDYWQIAARASNADGRSGNIEWPYPAEPDQPPFGILHHFAPLGLIDVAAAVPVTLVSDCRSLFPPLTRLKRLYYVGGDGQDGAPGAALPLPIEVEVCNPCGPVGGARIEFRVVTGGLGASTDPTVTAPLAVRQELTDGNGRARVFWRLGAAFGPQEATAVLLGAPLAGSSLRFTANANVAVGCGELVARTAQELRAIFASIPPGADAHVCIAPGRYEFRETVVVGGKGHLKISAGGDATVLVAEGLGTVLRFEACNSVTMRDLRVEVQLEARVEGPSGALEFLACPRVTLEHLRVSTTGGAFRAASCIAVRGELERPCSLRIHSCDLWAGDGQLGIMAIDCERAEIADNTVRVAPRFRKFRDKIISERVMVNGRATYGRYVDGIGKFLIHTTHLRVGRLDEARRGSQPRPALAPPPVVRGLYTTRLEARVSAAVGRDERRAARTLGYIQRTDGRPLVGPGEAGAPLWEFRYQTPVALVGDMADLLRRSQPLPPRVPATFTTVKEHVARTIDDLVTRFVDSAELGDPFSLGLTLLEQEHRAVGYQGILVAGRVTGETRVLNNTVVGFMMGIHVGHSSRDHKYRRSARTLIVRNTVTVSINGEHWHERHGIFSGNAANTIIEDNAVTADRTPMALNMPLEGIRAYGVFGPMMMIRANQMIDCEVGVRAIALNPASQSASVWRVVDNAVRGTSTPFHVVPPMP